MSMGQAQQQEGRSKLTLEQLEHLRKSHLTIFFDKEKDAIEIGWVCRCGEDRCHAPHTIVTFSACPSRPCPPGRI